MASFSLPPINDNPDGGWGPSTSHPPDQFKFKDIPYAPYSKSDKLGRFADWNDLSADNRQSTIPTALNQRGGQGGRRREGAQAFGSGTASAFAYFHVEDESSFSLVDNKATAPRRGSGFIRGRGNARGGATYGATRGSTRGRGGFAGRGNQNQRNPRRGWRDWDKVRFLNCRIGSLSEILYAEQSYTRVFRGHFASMVNARRNRVPSACQVTTRSRRSRGTVSLDRIPDFQSLKHLQGYLWPTIPLRKILRSRYYQDRTSPSAGGPHQIQSDDL